MWLTPSSTARRSTAIASSRLRGAGSQGIPVTRIAPYPIRLTVRSPRRQAPDAAAEGTAVEVPVAVVLVAEVLVAAVLVVMGTSLLRRPPVPSGMAGCCRSWQDAAAGRRIETMRTGAADRLVYDEDELFSRTRPLFETATDVACAANHLGTWAMSRDSSWFDDLAMRSRDKVRVRKVFRAGTLLEPASAEHLATVQQDYGAQIRITTDDINETIIFDRRRAGRDGDVQAGRRGYSVISQPEVVQGITSLYEAAWRTSTDLEGYDARIAEVRELAPRVLDLLARGTKDEAAARLLGLGVRTYRRRVAELMDALGAESRFQAGLLAGEMGLV